MDPFFHLVEQRIEAALREGAFDNLAGQGRALELEDLSNVPEELRTSYILLKAHGLLPPELEARKEWLRLDHLLQACTDDGERELHRAECNRARLRYRLLLERDGGGSALVAHRDQLLSRLERG